MEVQTQKRKLPVAKKKKNKDYAAAVRKFIFERGGNRRAIVELSLELGVSDVTVWRWATDRSVPRSQPMRERIESVMRANRIDL